MEFYKEAYRIPPEKLEYSSFSAADGRIPQMAGIAFLFSLPNQKDDMQLRDLAVLVLLYESGARVQEFGVNLICNSCKIRTEVTTVMTGTM